MGNVQYASTIHVWSLIISGAAQVTTYVTSQIFLGDFPCLQLITLDLAGFVGHAGIDDRNA